ncbi:MoaD/ThiS family protein [Dictyobacter aurantiacus]|uniref:Thiamine biosynthesis protein ThiS n=1 Tax=Dictyobacter aurantiacus TaxID=1936993 RepID=A0A401Z7Y0_9CHLR|nr:MoaD/ThiS family protein [Dictyobacter aurantiacus]GCE02953.1 thiamine biosynthesis protein ThiS [Dictyobacter aurantiacus]
MSDSAKVTATLRLPSTLSAYSGGKSQITVEAETVEQLLNALHKEHPLVWERLCTEQGAIREHVRIFVNNQLISGNEGLKTVLSPGQEVIVLPTTFNA